MEPTNDRSPVPESELRNKDETELPIGTVAAPESRSHAMWRCGDCGEMGELRDALPDGCPTCAAPRELLYYWEAD